MIKEIYEAGKKYAKVIVAAGILASPMICEPSCSMSYSQPSHQVALQTQPGHNLESLTE